jgi:hypothetical protein
MEVIMRKWFTLSLLALAVSAPAAHAQGGSILSIGVFQGTGDYAGPENGTGYISAFDHSEIGVGAEYWYMFSADYALALQGSIGFFSESNEPGANAAPGSPEAKFTTSSMKLRVGGDRVGQIGDRFTWFMGPGIEYWTGKATFENIFAAGELETESTSRVGISGRVGGIMKLSDSIGLQGQVGHTLGSASAEDAGAKATWYPSSFNASWGLAFSFGGQ